MPRSVNAVASRRRRKRILKLAKGYFGSRSKVYTIAKNTVEKGLLYAYRDRKTKKREFRALWIQRINAGARQHGISYSQFIGKLNAKNIGLNRKVLADLAMNNPATRNLFSRPVSHWHALDDLPVPANSANVQE
jgi:large subunit ribosomal protein L20